MDLEEPSRRLDFSLLRRRRDGANEMPPFNAVRLGGPRGGHRPRVSPGDAVFPPDIGVEVSRPVHSTRTELSELRREQPRWNTRHVLRTNRALPVLRV